jgi:Cdc6-like AAA superfamily ATPase
MLLDISSKPPTNGDIRYALGLLLYSGNLALNRASDHITLEDVRRVISIIHTTITDEDILNLSIKGKITLMAIVRSLKNNKNTYTTLRDIRMTCGVVCEEYGFKPFEDIEEQIQDLGDREIVDIRSLTSIGISGLPTEDLDRFLDGLIDRIKGGLDGSS